MLKPDAPGRLLRWLWAAPCTLVGLAGAAPLLLAGGRARLHGATLLVWRYRSTAACGRLSRRLPYRAVTLGHVILAVSGDELDGLLAHELVHVRQYERWGPAFFVAYPAASLWQWLRGRRAYWDNPFEVEARRRGGG